MTEFKSYQDRLLEKINAASYGKLSINEKINVKAFYRVRSPFTDSHAMRRVVKSNPYIYTGDFSRLPIKTGKGYSI